MKPKPQHYPSALDTLDQYQKACRDLELPTDGTKTELKRRLREASTTFRFFDEIEAEYVRRAGAEGAL